MVNWPSLAGGARQGHVRASEDGVQQQQSVLGHAGRLGTRDFLQHPGLGKPSSRPPRCQWKLKQAARKRAGCGRQELAGENPERFGPRRIRGRHRQAVINAGS